MSTKIKPLTLQQKIIIMGFTDAVTLQEESFTEFHKDLEKRLKRPVFIHEMPALKKEIRELYREDFIKLCS